MITTLRTNAEPPQPAAFCRLLRGNVESAPIVVICDPPKRAALQAGLPTDPESLKLFARYAFPAGLTKEDFLFVMLCPPMPRDALNSESRKWAHVEPHVDAIWERIRATNPRCIVTWGKEASRVILGRAVAITKARGKAVRHEDYLVLPMLSPSMILKVPDHAPTFNADVQTLARLKQDNFAVVEQVDTDVEYEWREDIQDIIDLHPGAIGVDTETTGLRWHDPAVDVITVQIAYAPGRVAVCPVHTGYWPEWEGRPRFRARLLGQIRTLMSDPTIKKVGHNFKFDIHMLRKLGIEVRRWEDTQLKAFGIDENMMEKSLDECVRRWVPDMAGYADSFNQSVDKANMLGVERAKMLPYAAGDADAVLRLDTILDDLLARDPDQERCYRLIQLPAMYAFSGVVERTGMLIDQNRLTEFGGEVNQWLKTTYPALIGRTPPAIRRRHLEAGKELKFSRPDFTRDVLFDPEGLNLTPIVFTKGTRDLENPAERIASTSAKDHLPFFADPATPTGQFVLDLIDFQKTTKLEGSFIGAREEGNGLWQYISPLTGRIYPSYMLHRAVTGRTASADPNGQNFPKRGRWAKAYQSIFRASPGFKLVNCDLSQIELRIAAWMAMEPVMLRIYREGGDIHTATAKYVSGLTDAQWNALAPRERKELRTKAKAVNFGFLYGMGARKFRAFAKTDYGVDYSERESYQTRDRFFALYGRLEPWHTAMREFVKQHGYVRALHGAVRHLPSIWSDDPMIVASAERQAVNSPVQRFGSDLGLISMARFTEQADPDLFRIIGFIHDALVMEVRDGYEQEGVQALLYAMESNPLTEWFGITPPLPLLAEADIGLTGGSMLEFADLPPVEERPDWFLELGFDTVSAVKPQWWDDSVDEEWAHVHARN
jgi:uracil-DNA glycosylase family 4